MSVSRRREKRILDTSEADLVARSRRPHLSAERDAEISELIRLLRDRARGVSRRQRREVRGKAAPSGIRPASDNSGTREKAALLAAAVKRVSKERERRSTTASHARRALAKKQAAGDPAAGRPPSRYSNDGMHPIADDTRAPSGALDEAGQEIARRRGGGPC